LMYVTNKYAGLWNAVSRFGSARDEGFARKNEAVQRAYDGDMVERHRDQIVTHGCRPSVQCVNTTCSVHVEGGTRSGKAKCHATYPYRQECSCRSTDGGHSSAERSSVILGDVESTLELRSGSMTLFPIPTNEWPTAWQT
jgi:hypothetical protein